MFQILWLLLAAIFFNSFGARCQHSLPLHAADGHLLYKILVKYVLA